MQPVRVSPIPSPSSPKLSLVSDNGSTTDLEPIAKARRVDYTQLGSTGLQQYGGFIQDEFLRQLQGDRAIKVYREMGDNDPVCGALLFAIDMLVRQVEWRVEPAEALSVEAIVEQRRAEREEAQAAAEEAAQARADMQEMAMQQMAGGGPGEKGADGKPGSKRPPSKLSKAAREVWPYLTLSEQIEILKAESAVARAEGNGVRGKSGSGSESESRDVTGPGTTSKLPPGVEEISSEEAQAEELAVFVETALHDMAMSWPETLSTITSMLPFGFHYAEILYKKRGGETGKDNTQSRFDDGRIGWRKIDPRAQETRHRWEFDKETGNLLGMWQMDPASGRGIVFLPIEKCLLFRTENRKGSPEGRSIFRSAYRPWYFKKRIEEIEAIGIERDLAGLPVAYVPYQMLSPSATVEEIAAREEIKKIVRNIKRDEQEGVVFPMAFDPESGNKLYELALLSTGGQRQFDTDKIVARYDQRMAMVVLADFILLGHEKVGSYSLGQTKADLFTAALEAWLNGIAEVFNTHAIPRLMRANNVNPAMSPTLSHGRLTQVDLGVLGAYIQQLAAAGAPLFPDEALEGYLRDVAGMPTKMGSDEI